MTNAAYGRNSDSAVMVEFARSIAAALHHIPELPHLNARQFANVPVGSAISSTAVAPHRDSPVVTLALRAYGATSFKTSAMSRPTSSSMPMVRSTVSAGLCPQARTGPCGSEFGSKDTGLLQAGHSTSCGRVINDPAIRDGEMGLHDPRALN